MPSLLNSRHFAVATEQWSPDAAESDDNNGSAGARKKACNYKVAASFEAAVGLMIDAKADIGFIARVRIHSVVTVHYVADVLDGALLEEETF